MKTLNLVVGIIYSVIYLFLFLSGIADNDTDLSFGVIVLSVPVIANWITYSNLSKEK